MNALNRKIDKIAITMESSKIKDYVNYIESPRKIFISNFLAGLARGFGASIGFTILAAIIIYLLQMVMRWNLPLIGNFISEIIEIVQYIIRNTRGAYDG